MFAVKTDSSRTQGFKVDSKNAMRIGGVVSGAPTSCSSPTEQLKKAAAAVFSRVGRGLPNGLKGAVNILCSQLCNWNRSHYKINVVLKAGSHNRFATLVVSPEARLCPLRNELFGAVGHCALVCFLNCRLPDAFALLLWLWRAYLLWGQCLVEVVYASHLLSSEPL